ncbi:MAG: NTP transferase domain-containing protein [Gemmatimonadaceae bacterium]|nr:NTP transferase domain-containing protein [Gemmatimonadaceae bacterium]
MRALILAAGRGTRLGPDWRAPKCLLPIGGVPLLQRYHAALRDRVSTIRVVVGHQSDTVRAAMGASMPTVEWVENAEFEHGSILSIAAGLRDHEGPLLLMDGDVFFAPALLDALLAPGDRDALLVDLDHAFTGEEYMAGVEDGHVRRLQRAALPLSESGGEWVGFATLTAASVERLRREVSDQISRGEIEGGYEDALARAITTQPTMVIPTAGEPWTEIDVPDDRVCAEALARDLGAQS